MDNKIISLDDHRDFKVRCLEEIEFYKDRLAKLEMRLSIVSEELRQTNELLSILENELHKGG